MQYMYSVLRIKKDPLYFVEDILGAKEGLRKRPVQRSILEEFYGHKYDPLNNSMYKKLVLVAGQRSGKTVLASFIMAYEFTELLVLDNPSKHYNLLNLGNNKRGQKIACTCLATSRDQASDGVFSNMMLMMESNEWFNQWFNLKFKDQRIECQDKNLLAQVLAARADTSAGYTNKCVVFDELDLFEKTDSKKGADMVFSKLSNSTQTFKNEGKIVAISSLQFPDGMMTRVYKEALEEENALAFKYATWEMNPDFTKEGLLKEHEYKMHVFWRDFANRPEVSAGVQFPEGIVLNRSMHNVLMDPEYSDTKIRVMSIDPAAKNDSFGVAVGYRVGDNIFIDGVRRFEKPYSEDAVIRPSDVSNFILDAIPRLGINAFIHDIYMYPELLQRVRDDCGFDPIMHQVKKEDYDRWREMQEPSSPTRLNIVYNEHLRRECEALLVKDATTAAPKIAHPWNGSKDTADCVANCIWFLTNDELDLDFSTVVAHYYII